MATPKRMKPYRSWSSVDSVDPNDVHRLCEAEIGEGDSKSSIPGGRCVSTWTFSLVVLIISVFLLVGLFVGYYIRDGQNYSASEHPVCDYTLRTDGHGPERLEMVHENLMYLMSGQRITDTAGKMEAISLQKSGTISDEKMVNYVHENLKNLGMDKVETIKYKVEVVSLDPETPSTISVSKAGKEKFVLKPGEENPEATEEGGGSGGGRPLLSVPGRAVGPLVYGFYGRRQDLFYLKKSITLRNSVLLLKTGETSILEKLRLASLESVSGVLLYQDPSESAVSQEEFELVSYQLANGKFHIPVQLITDHESNQLLRELQDDGVVSPGEWTDANRTRLYTGIISSNNTSPVIVDMDINVVKKEETITNVIGSIYGDMEPDRFVVIGAVREETSGGDLDLGLGTAHLMEMAQSFVNIKFAEKWGPRRGVRFCSWGGGKSLRGLLEHLKMNKYVFGEQTLAYIDLDLYIQRTSTDKTIFEVSSSPALQILIQHVLHQVPHPQDKQFTIADWQYDRPYNQFVAHGNQAIRDTLHSQGILVVSAGYIVNQEKDNEDSAVLHDALHHDQYHLAATRVLSLVSLHLMDDNHLPHSLLNYTKFIHDVYGRSLIDLSKADAVVDRELFSKTIDQLLRIGKAFEAFVSSKDFTRIPMGSRRMNDIKMGVDKIMVSPPELRCTSPLLYGAASDGSSLLLKEAIKTANITKDWKEVQRIVNDIIQALEEVMSYLQFS